MKARRINMNNIVRTPITIASERGVSFGKWFPFPVDENKQKPKVRGLDSTVKLLWCPYCNEWTIFRRDYGAAQEGLMCTGVCGWSHTNDFYVRQYNHLWNGGK